jgi:hypothetical protein
MSNDTNNNGAAAVAETEFVKAKIVHCRDEAERKTLENVMPEALKNARVVFGLTVPTQAELIAAVRCGDEIITTGLPLDVASSLGKVTVLRAWDKALPGGGRSTGCQPPRTLATMEIMDEEAYAELIASPLYLKAIGKGGTPTTEEVP